MKQVKFGKTGLMVPAVVSGCMRFSNKTPREIGAFIDHAVSLGINFFDHADIYAGGACEELFGEALEKYSSAKREDLIIQSKCGIVIGKMFDFSKEHIIASVEGSLKRLKTDHLDVLLLHRPDALVEPEEVAEAFDRLEESGKVRYFGVSNHKPMQIELLKRCLRQEIQANQLQFGIGAAQMVANGLEVNMETYGATDRDGSVLDYSRVNDITIQAWSPYQLSRHRGQLIGSEELPELNACLDALAEKYNTTPTAIAAAWVMRHPAGIQLVAGTTSEPRLEEIAAGADIVLTREEWYSVLMKAGHILP